MKFLLDTNAVIAFMKGNERLHARMQQHRPADFVLSVVVMYELLYGAYHSQRVQQNLTRVESLRFEVIGLDQGDARAAAQLRAELARRGTPVGPCDVLIAGQAWSRRLTLITRNMREFERIGQIRAENWED